MTDQEWSQALAIFEAARELPLPARRAFVESYDAPEHLRQEVLQLLDGDEPEAEDEGPQKGQQYGRYELLEPLGQGGMGVVYAARDKELGRLVALKFVAAGARMLPAAVDRLIYEAQAASALNHPNLVTVYEVLRTDAGVALVTELVEGQSLRAACGKAHDRQQIAAWGAQIARGLAASHARGIVHGDIKPENVMVRPDGYLKILDFGLAQKDGMDHKPSWDSIPLGSLGYMSPEQTTGSRLSPATDVFSLGVVLLELATGKHPFLESTVSGTTRAINEREVLLPESSQVSDRALRPLLKAMLEKDPAKRPAAGEVAARLESVATGRGSQRWLAWVAAATAGVAAIAAMAWYALRPQSMPPLPAPVAVTSFTGVESQPALSPDGSQVAFVWTGLEDAEHSIYVKSVEHEDLRRLTTDRREHSTPAWSPDGKWIAYVRRASDGSDSDVLLQPAGGGEERLVGHVVDHQGYRGLAWWPDSQSLITRDAGPRGRPLVRLFLDGSKQILTASSETHDAYPVVSPDGATLAFLRTQLSTYSICRIPLAGGSERCIALGRQAPSLAWYPDSRTLLFCDNRGIWRIDPNDEQQLLLEASVNELAMAGSRMIFGRSTRDMNIWRTDVDTGKTAKIIASSEEDSEPEFSPDGQSILFRSKRSGYHELFLCDRNGQQLRQLTRLNAHSGSARWSPDGRWIAFDSDYRTPGESKAATHYSNIFVIAASGGELRKLTDGTRERMVPGWSHDSRWVYYTEEPGSRRETWKVPVEGGSPVRVSATEMFDMIEPPDGQWLYYARPRDKAPGIWRRRTNGDATPERLPNTEDLVYRSWDLRAGHLLLLRSSNDPAFVRLDPDGSGLRKLAPAPRSVFNGPRNIAISPDGKTILFTQLDLTLGDLFRIDLDSQK